MKGFVPPDPETQVSGAHFGVVYQPRKRKKRFPVASVELFDTEEQAKSAADPERKRFPAAILGPSKSSEGQFIYYLVEWLDRTDA
jgi:hypothetical protein